MSPAVCDAGKTEYDFSDNNYEWPNLYEEADDMMDLAYGIYAMAEMRALAKSKPDLFDNPEEVLKEPMNGKEFTGLMGKYMPMLMQNLAPSSIERFKGVIAEIVERQKKVNPGKPQTVMRQFGDDNSNSELVYSICVDRATKRVIVVFRGSSTTQDFVTDSQAWMEMVKNPMHRVDPSQPKELGIHNGFHDYLFYDSTSGKVGEDGDLLKKFDVILEETDKILEENPSFNLYITGHSLGGALATLFSFLVASSFRSDISIPKPVTCVSVASPFVGDVRFRRAFQLCEKKGLLRHLRISNNSDIVTIMPMISLLRLVPYKHVGINLKLFPERHEISYPHQSNRIQRAIGNFLFGNLGNWMDNHLTEYGKRMEVARDTLATMKLNDLYKDKKLMTGY